MPDLVRDGATGFLVDPGDVATLALRIRQVMDDGALWTNLSTASRQEIQRYDWPSVIARLEEQLCLTVEHGRASVP